MGRFSLAQALWVVALFAFGFAALRNASDFWVGATFVVMFGMLCVALLGSVLERDQARAWWLGFALFGWAYLAADLWPRLGEASNLPTWELSQEIFRASNPSPLGRPASSSKLNGPALRIGPDGRPVAPTAGVGPARLSVQQYTNRVEFNVGRIGHWLFVLLFARAGALASCIFTKGLPWRKKLAKATPASPLPTA